MKLMIGHYRTVQEPTLMGSPVMGSGLMILGRKAGRSGSSSSTSRASQSYASYQHVSERTADRSTNGPALALPEVNEKRSPQRHNDAKRDGRTTVENATDLDAITYAP